jgi:hypothetical protein
MDLTLPSKDTDFHIGSKSKIQQSVVYKKTPHNLGYTAIHVTFSKTDHIIGYKANFNKYKKTEISHCILTDHNGIKLEINSKENHKNHSNSWRLNNTLLNKQWIIEDIRKELKKIPRIK